MAGFLFVAFVRQQQPSLWECGKPRFVRLSKLGGRGDKCVHKAHSLALRASFPQRTSRFPASLEDFCFPTALSWEKCAFTKPASNEYFYRFLRRAGSTSGCLIWKVAALDPKSGRPLIPPLSPHLDSTVYRGVNAGEKLCSLSRTVRTVRAPTGECTLR